MLIPVSRVITTQKEINHVLKKLAPTLTGDEHRNRIVCSLIRHSNIRVPINGKMMCARCKTFDDGAAVNTLVVVGHGCGICKENYKKLDWMDTIFVDEVKNKTVFPKEKKTNGKIQKSKKQKR